MRKQAATGRGYVTKGITTFKSKKTNTEKRNKRTPPPQKKTKPEIESLGEKIPILTTRNRENTSSQTTKNCNLTMQQVLQMPMSADVFDTK